MFRYVPFELFDCGGLGEWPVLFEAEIDVDYTNGRETYAVKIVRATVSFDFASKLQTLDVTELINGRPYSRDAWHDAIYAAFRGKRDS